MDLRVPITITDELSEEVISATGLLNLASGEIGRIDYQDYDVDERGAPWESDEYEFTSGTLSNAGKDVEFRVDVNRTTGQYSVSATELLEIKVRAAALFAGVTGRDLLANAPQAHAPIPGQGEGTGERIGGRPPERTAGSGAGGATGKGRGKSAGKSAGKSTGKSTGKGGVPGGGTGRSSGRLH